jgi:hypothetical protein
MLIKTYLKWIIGCILGILIIDVILALLGLAIIMGLIYNIIKNILVLIFHPIRFFKENKGYNKTTLKDLIGFDWKDFIDIENELKIKRNLQKNKQKNKPFSKNNIQIGNITIKGE